MWWFLSGVWLRLGRLCVHSRADVNHHACTPLTPWKSTHLKLELFFSLSPHLRLFPWLHKSEVKRRADTRNHGAHRCESASFFHSQSRGKLSCFSSISEVQLYIHTHIIPPYAEHKPDSTELKQLLSTHGGWDRFKAKNRAEDPLMQFKSKAAFPGERGLSHGHIHYKNLNNKLKLAEDVSQKWSCHKTPFNGNKSDHFIPMNSGLLTRCRNNEQVTKNNEAQSTLAESHPSYAAFSCILC